MMQELFDAFVTERGAVRLRKRGRRAGKIDPLVALASASNVRTGSGTGTS